VTLKEEKRREGKGREEKGRGEERRGENKREEDRGPTYPSHRRGQAPSSGAPQQLQRLE